MHINKEGSKAIAISLFFLLVFVFVPANWHYVADFEFHFQKLQGCQNHYDEEACKTYFPLLHLLGGIFAFSKLAFARFLMFLIVFVTPMALFFVTRKWITVWFYFSTTQYLYLIEGGGAYPQALTAILLLFLLGTKNNYVRGIILVAAMLSHSQGFYLIAVAWFVIAFFESKKAMNFFPACSGVFGTTVIKPLTEKIDITVLNINGPQILKLPIKDVLNFFVRGFPFPFLIASIYQLIMEKNYAPIVLAGIFFYAGIAMTPRIFIIIPLILLPALTSFYFRLSGWPKKAFLGLTVLSFVFQFGTWALYKINCLNLNV